MGLEELPNCTQACDTSSQMSCMSDGYNQHQSLVSPITRNQCLGNSRRDNALIENSRFSLKPIPWRQPDASQDPDLQVSKGSETLTTASKSFHSVYGEIEKRIADLQFKNSGKDLRALKQILEAMQRYKDSLDITRDQEINYPSDRGLSESSELQTPRQQTNPTFVTDDISSSPQGRKFPIIIMKLAQISRKSNVATKEMTNGKSGRIKFSTNDPKDGRLLDNIESQIAKGTSSTNPFSQRFHSADKSNMKKTSKLMQASKVPQVINGEDTNNSSHTAETRSPRVQNKFGFEKCSPTNQSSESKSKRRQHKQSSESLSLSSTPKQKVCTLQQRNEGFSKIRCQKRNFKHQVDVISSNVDSNRSMDSHRDIEGTQADHSESNNIISIQQFIDQTATKELSKESAMAMITVTSEQQSPVSVLDLQFYSEDPPSPIKKKTETSKDLGIFYT
nr:protein LONGIFOLIA 2-like [Arachis hypogaea]